MTFEIKKDDRVVFTTTYMNCIPKYEHLVSMSSNGYKFVLNGKVVGLKKIKSEIKEEW